MSRVQWDIAPRWAEGLAVSPHGEDAWLGLHGYLYLLSGGKFHEWGHPGSIPRDYFKVIELRPVPWAAGDLPPVGVDAEVLFDSHPPKYVACKVLAHDEGRAVYRFTAGPRKGEYGSDLARFESFSLVAMFRPLRTPEQIAKEDREAQAKELFQLINPESKWHKCDHGPWLAAYDAGYRKVQP